MKVKHFIYIILGLFALYSFTKIPEIINATNYEMNNSSLGAWSVIIMLEIIGLVILLIIGITKYWDRKLL